MNRDRILTAVELASSASLTIGAATIAPAAGWITAGVVGLLFAWRSAS